MAELIGPRNSQIAATWDISRCRSSECTVDARLLAASEGAIGSGGVATTHPGPFVCCRIKPPEIVECAGCGLTGRVVANSAKQPEAAAAVSPSCGSIPCARD